jgi:hypothetical protein
MLKQLLKKVTKICFTGFFLILAIQSLTFAAGETTVAKFLGDKKAAISVNFDDSTIDHSDYVIPHLNAHNIKGSFAVCPAGLGWIFRQRNWREIAPKYGHGLHDHTMNHTGASNYENAVYEMGRCAEIIREIPAFEGKLLAFARGGGTVWTLTDEEDRKIRQKYNLVGRGGAEAGGGATNATTEQLLAYVKDALDKGIWYSLTMHGLGPRAPYLYPTEPEAFDTFLELIEENKDSLWSSYYTAIYKYAKERDDAKIEILKSKPGTIQLDVKTPNLDAKLYDHPLTLITSVPSDWKYFAAGQGKTKKFGKVTVKDNQPVAKYDIIPNSKKITLKKVTDPKNIDDIEKTDIDKIREYVKNALLEGLKPRSLIDLEGNIMCYVYKGKNPVAALWYDGNEESSFAVLQNNSHITDIYDKEGNKIETDKTKPIYLTLTSKPIYIKGKDTDELEYGFLYDTEVYGNRTLKTFIDLGDSGKAIKITSTNLSPDKKYEGEYTITLPSGEKKDVRVKLAPRRSKTHTFPVDDMYDKPLQISVSHSENGKKYTDSREFMITLANKIKSKITIDGNLEDWSGMDECRVSGEEHIFEKEKEWKGPKDCSFTFSTGYDKDTMYVAVRVTDNHYVQTYNDVNNWRNDCLELFFDMDLPGDRTADFYSKDDIQIMLSKQTIDEKAITKIANGIGNSRVDSTPEYKKTLKEIARNVDMAIVSQEGGYIIEASVPWSLLHNFKPDSGKSIGFNIAVDDSDQESKAEIDRELMYWTSMKEFTERKFQMAWRDSWENCRLPNTLGILFLE